MPMSLKWIRVKRLKQLQSERRIPGPVELGKIIGKSTSQTSDLLNGRASFGEKVARTIEVAAGLPSGWLDDPGETAVPDRRGNRSRVGHERPPEMPPTTRDYWTIAHTLAKALKDAEMEVSVDQFLRMADGIYKQWGGDKRPEKVPKSKVSS